METGWSLPNFYCNFQIEGLTMAAMDLEVSTGRLELLKPRTMKILSTMKMKAWMRKFNHRRLDQILLVITGRRTTTGE